MNEKTERTIQAVAITVYLGLNVARLVKIVKDHRAWQKEFDAQTEEMLQRIREMPMPKWEPSEEMRASMAQTAEKLKAVTQQLAVQHQQLIMKHLTPGFLAAKHQEALEMNEDGCSNCHAIMSDDTVCWLDLERTICRDCCSAGGQPCTHDNDQAPTQLASAPTGIWSTK